MRHNHPVYYSGWGSRNWDFARITAQRTELLSLANSFSLIWRKILLNLVLYISMNSCSFH